MRGNPTRTEGNQHVQPHQHRVGLLDSSAGGVTPILWVEVQLLGVLKSNAGSYLGYCY